MKLTNSNNARTKFPKSGLDLLCGFSIKLLLDDNFVEFGDVRIFIKAPGSAGIVLQITCDLISNRLWYSFSDSWKDLTILDHFACVECLVITLLQNGVDTL